MNSNIFKAILSMDSYNRGYNAGIDLRARDANGNVISDDSIGQYIGSALVTKESDIAQNSSGVEAGFYGIAYSYNNETIISYRGTDQLPAAISRNCC